VPGLPVTSPLSMDDAWMKVEHTWNEVYKGEIGVLGENPVKVSLCLPQICTWRRRYGKAFAIIACGRNGQKRGESNRHILVIFSFWQRQ